jgi:hypothetical protein
MTRAGLQTVLTPTRVYWGLAALVLPLANPVLIVVVGGLGALALAAAANFMVLWFAAQRAWQEQRSRHRALFWGMLIAAACTVAAAYIEFVIVLAIAAQSCPPDAYECPI